jgi:hypothetical protein
MGQCQPEPTLVKNDSTIVQSESTLVHSKIKAIQNPIYFQKKTVLI